MLFYFTLTTLLLMCNTVAQTRVSELETCVRNLERSATDFQQLLDVINNLIPAINNVITSINNINNIKLETPPTIPMTPTPSTSTTQTTPTKPTTPTVPSNCADLLKMGNTKSRIYGIYPKSLNGTFNELSVYCDMETDDGGWIVFQRRADFLSREDFTQTWAAYKRGFGQLDREFWLGNENIYMLTRQENVTLRVDLEDFEGEIRYATYDNFKIAYSADKYRLHLGNYTGNAGDSLRYHDNMEFATWDNDNSNKCADQFKGGWWYDNCHHSNLNGQYKKGPGDYANVVSWRGFKGASYSLKKSEMKIRPSDFKKLT